MTKPSFPFRGITVVGKILLALALLLAGTKGWAQQLLITDFSIGLDNKIRVHHTSQGTQYYILYRGDTVTAITFPRVLHLGASEEQIFIDDLPTTSTAFYRILGVPQSQPRDVDGDQIDDVYELLRPNIFSPINPLDALADSDGDGISNVDEYLAGTDPTQPDQVFEILEPADGGTYLAPANITIRIQVADPQISRVEYFAGQTMIGQSTTSPFTFIWLNPQPGDYELRAEAITPTKRLVSQPARVTVNIPAPTLDPIVEATKETLLTITGTALPSSTVLVEGGRSAETVRVPASGNFEIIVPLNANRVNQLYVSSTSLSGRLSSVATATVRQDAQSPNLFIDFPPDNTQVITDSTVIAGRVGDVISGSLGLQVEVAGLPANVNVGLGNNGTFERGAVPLQMGRNVITVTARDQLGNTITKETVINRVQPGGGVLEAESGDLQKAIAQRRLPNPVIVKVTDGNGQPLPNKIINFEVVRSDGRLWAEPDDLRPGNATIQVVSDLDGRARAWWNVGTDAGKGNNRLRVWSKDITGDVFFCASADARPASQINIGTGNNQVSEAGALTPEPLVAWVNDSCNPIVGMNVTFTVVGGDGRLFAEPPAPGTNPPGETTLTVPSGITGHAKVYFRLGSAPGNNIVEANFPQNPSAPAIFTLRGVARGTGVTSLVGLVQDDSSVGLGGADCYLNIGEQFFRVTSDDGGRFVFTDIPAGPAKLLVNALTATTRGGLPIPPGTYPSLKSTQVIIPNTENHLPKPILLPRLNPANARVWDGTGDLVLTCEGIAGLRMIIKAGSMRLPDGTSPNPANPTVVSLNQVRHSEIPMPMTDGASPPFAWTLQPAGAVFDPPVRVEYPNMTGLPAGAIAYFLTYNHDSQKFEINASGHVTADGSTIVTDPGAGISLAGWGCNCPPYSVTGSCGGCN